MASWSPNPYYSPYECAVCRRYPIDPLDTPKHDVSTAAHRVDVCRDCISACGHCGEFLDNTTIPALGPAIRFRDPLADGKLAEAHAMCAASYILSLWTGDRTFDIHIANKETITLIVAGLMACA